MSDDSESGLEPPPAERVAKRALVLASVYCRSTLERHAGDPGAERTQGLLLRWIEALELAGEFEGAEMDLVRAPLGRLTERQWVDASWRSEGLAVLAWVLGRAELPPWDVQADGYELASAVGVLASRETTVLAKPSLRADDEVAFVADELLAALWRLRQFSIDGGSLQYAEIAAGAWFGPDAIARLPLADGDLALRGIAIGRAPESLRREVTSIVRERQQAANWLLGEEPVYSMVTCDT